MAQALLEGVIALGALFLVTAADVSAGVLIAAVQFAWRDRQESRRRITERLYAYTDAGAAQMYGTRYDDGYAAHRSVDDKAA
jgi:hypothetical protein